MDRISAESQKKSSAQGTISGRGTAPGKAPRTASLPAPVQRKEEPGQAGPTSAEIEAMSEEQLKQIVFGPGGHVRFIVGTGQRGQGWDGQYSYEQWSQARSRLSVIGQRKGGGGLDNPEGIHETNQRGFEVSTERQERLQEDASYRRDVEKSQRVVNGRVTNSARRAQRRVDAAESEAFADNRKGGWTRPQGQGQGQGQGRGQSSSAADRVDVGGDVLRGGGTLWNEAAGPRDEWSGVQGPAGSQREGQYTVLGTKAGYTGGVSAGPDGVAADASVSASASLLSFSEELQWEFGNLTLLGEQTGGKLFVNISGMVGAEAKAQLSARAQKLDPQEPRINPDALTSGIDLGAGASAEAFAGAKLTIGAGVVYEWKKKDESAYRGKLDQSAALILDLVSMNNPALGWLLRQMGGEQATEQILNWLFSWGAQGTLPIIGVEALVEGSAGIGGKIHGACGFKNGKFEFNYGANATWGLGLGGQVKVSIDAVEGMKFALVVGGELRPMAQEWAQRQINQAVSGGIRMAQNFWASFWSLFSGDDRAREAVANGAHTLMPASERATLVQKMCRGVCSGPDEEAILTVLEFSMSKGDATEVLAQMGGTRRAARSLLWNMDGANDRRMREILDDLGVAY